MLFPHKVNHSLNETRLSISPSIHINSLKLEMFSLKFVYRRDQNKTELSKTYFMPLNAANQYALIN